MKEKYTKYPSRKCGYGHVPHKWNNLKPTRTTYISLLKSNFYSQIISCNSIQLSQTWINMGVHILYSRNVTTYMIF